MKRKLVIMLCLTMLMACVSACGNNKTQTSDVTKEENVVTSETTDVVEEVVTTETSEIDEVVSEENNEVSEFITYEFETFDGDEVIIKADTILSQEPCDEPLEWSGLPSDAEQLATDRDCILFEDANNYYIEDVTNKLVTIAFKELGDIIEATDFAIFDNDVYTFEYDTNYFVLNEDEESVTVSFYNEDTQTAGSNTLTFKQIENADAMEVVKELVNQYGMSEDSIIEFNFGATSLNAFAATMNSTEGEVGVKTRTMVCAVANENNVIAIEVFTHVESDEGMDMFINDKISEILDTFDVK